MAAKLAVEEYRHTPIEVWYCDTRKWEHPDNERFLLDVAKWIGKPIRMGRTSNPDYLDRHGKPDIYRVFKQTGWLVGPKGTRCTVELKKSVRHEIERPGDIQIFGFTSEETDRIERFKANNPDIQPDFILARKNVKKVDCFTALKGAGIELPMMYRMGYRNNNCIGCVKGQSGYWNKIRKDFPNIFKRMSKVERKMGVAINKRYEGKTRIPVYLDELPLGAGRYTSEPDIECGVVCASES